MSVTETVCLSEWFFNALLSLSLLMCDDKHCLVNLYCLSLSLSLWLCHCRHCDCDCHCDCDSLTVWLIETVFFFNALLSLSLLMCDDKHFLVTLYCLCVTVSLSLSLVPTTPVNPVDHVDPESADAGEWFMHVTVMTNTVWSLSTVFVSLYLCHSH